MQHDDQHTPEADPTEEHDPTSEHVEVRSQLLPEERAVGSDDPEAQAEAVLEESAERTEHPDPDASSQSGRRRSEETL
ncbi:MAG: hypothetical protein ACLGIA_09350 [Actinomycetes bacterium]